MIASKIKNVHDDLCELCAQCFEGECRAYQFPHSEIERLLRTADPQGLCEIGLFAWHFRPDVYEQLQ